MIATGKHRAPANSSVDETSETDADSNDSLPFSEDPELIIGLVGPIGVDLDLVVNVLCAALDDVRYEAHTFRITELMREVSAALPLDAPYYIESFKQRITYANKVRELLDRNDALAILAISAIRAFRVQQGGSEGEPLPNQGDYHLDIVRPNP